MPFLIHAEEARGLLTMEAAIEAVAAGFSEYGRSPELNAPRRRITTPDGVRVSVHPGGVPSLGGYRRAGACRTCGGFKRGADLPQHGRAGDGVVRRQGFFVDGDRRRSHRRCRDRSGTADADAHGGDQRRRHALFGARQTPRRSVFSVPAAKRSIIF